MKTKMRGVSAVLFTLMFLVISSLCAGETFDQTALEQKLKNVSGDQERLKVLNELAFICRINAPKQALKYGTEARELSRRLNNKSEEAKALRCIGLGYVKLGKLEEGLECYYQALNLNKQIGNEVGEGKLLVSIGSVFWHFSDYETTLGYYERALEIFKKLDNKSAVSVILNNIGNVHLQRGKLDDALDTYLESLRLKEELGQVSRIGLTLNNIALLHKDLKEYRKALTCLERALELNKKNNNKRATSQSLHIIGEIHMHLELYQPALEFCRQSLEIKEGISDHYGIGHVLSTMGTIYLRQKDFPRALDFFQQALDNKKELKDKGGISQELSNIGDTYRKMKQHDKALSYLLESIDIAKQLKLKILLETDYFAVSEIYNAMGNTKKSMEFYKKYVDIKDKIFNKAVSSKIHDLQLKYEKDKMTRKLKAIEETKEKVTKYYLAVVALLILVSFLIVYNRYRLKQKAEFLLEQKDMEIQSQKQSLNILNKELKEFKIFKSRKKYEKSHLTNDQADDYLKKLLRIMRKEKPYLDSNITVTSLAQTLVMPPRDLSQVINEKLEKNFCDFINHYRINHARKMLLRSLGDPEISVLDIAYDVGFNSKSSFNTAFKKHTGMTPTRYRKYIIEKQSKESTV